MKTPKAPPDSHAARATLLVAVVIGACTGVATLVNVLADRFAKRFDVTATGDQRLSRRTLAMLSAMDAPYRVVIATDLRGVDPRSRERVRDVLGEMSKASRRFSSTFVDTGAGSGVEAYRRVVLELIDRDERLIREQAATIDLAIAACVSLSTYLTDTLSPRLLEVRDSVSGGSDQGKQLRQRIDDAGAVMRIASRELADAAGKAQDALKANLDNIPLPATDRAAGHLGEALTGTVQQLTSLSHELERFSTSEKGPGAETAKRSCAGLATP